MSFGRFSVKGCDLKLNFSHKKFLTGFSVETLDMTGIGALDSNFALRSLPNDNACTKCYSLDVFSHIPQPEQPLVASPHEFGQEEMCLFGKKDKISGMKC